MRLVLLVILGVFLFVDLIPLYGLDSSVGQARASFSHVPTATLELILEQGSASGNGSGEFAEQEAKLQCKFALNDRRKSLLRDCRAYCVGLNENETALEPKLKDLSGECGESFCIKSSRDRDNWICRFKARTHFVCKCKQI